MKKLFVLAGLMFFGISSGHGVEHGLEIDSKAKISRCEKLSKVLLYVDRNRIDEIPRPNEMDQALRSGGIDPQKKPSGWGLPWSSFGAVFATPGDIRRYMQRIMCETVESVDDQAKQIRCLRKIEDRFNLNDFSEYKPYKNGRLEFMPMAHEICDGKGYMIFKSNSFAFNKKHAVDEYLLSIEDLNFCSGVILSIKCRFGFMDTECILRENEEVLNEELALRKKKLNNPYEVKISSKEFDAAVKELSGIVEADGYQFNGTEGLKIISSGRMLQVDYIKQGEYRISLLNCYIYGDKEGMYTDHECKEHKF